MLASFVGGWGHAEPLLGVARLAAKRGHSVTFAGQAAVLPRVAALDFRTYTVGPDTLSSTRRPLVRIDRERERTVVRDHFVGEFGQLRAGLLGRLIATERTDLVLCDEMDAGAIVAAEAAGLPCVTVAVVAAGRLTAPDIIAPSWDQLRRDNGLPADPRCTRFAGSVRLNPFPASFRDPAVSTPFALHHVRPPILDEFGPPPAGRRGTRVYATLGTVFDVESGDLFSRLVRALTRIDADSVLTIGSNVQRGELPDAPERVRIEPYVPQRELLANCAAVICHGGSGTLAAALSAGLPVVVLPMGADQPDNADRCRDLGVGVVLDVTTAEPYDIADAIEEVVGDERYALAARDLAREAAAQPRPDDLQALAHLL